jgi:divalent metal cation (Fe/Co/Zn/Cd) transporter
MDVTLPDDENQAIASILTQFSSDDVSFHGLRTRVASSQRFAVVDMLVPGRWTVVRGHDLLEEVQSALQEAFPGISVQIHLEPKEDPRAYADFAVEVPIPPVSSPEVEK